MFVCVLFACRVSDVWVGCCCCVFVDVLVVAFAIPGRLTVLAASHKMDFAIPGRLTPLAAFPLRVSDALR